MQYENKAKQIELTCHLVANALRAAMGHAARLCLWALRLLVASALTLAAAADQVHAPASLCPVLNTAWRTGG
jgi:hypothetical protein